MKMGKLAPVSLILQGQKMQKVSCNFDHGLLNTAPQDDVAEILPVL